MSVMGTHSRNAGNPSMRSVLVAYILDGSQEFAELPDVTRVQISFLFELYIAGNLFKEQLFSATTSLFPRFADAAALLVMISECPGNLTPLLAQSEPNSHWGRLETLLLLGAQVFRGFLEEAVQFVLSNRSEESRRSRISHVIHDLQTRSLIAAPQTFFSNTECEKCSSIATQTDPPRTLERTAVVPRQRMVERMRQAVLTRRKFAQLRSRIAVCQRKIKRLELINFEYEKQTQTEQQCADLDIGPLQLSDCLLRECQFHMTTSPKERRYSQFLLSIGQLLHLTSPKGYQILRQLAPLPSPSCLWNHFSDEFGSLKSLLVDSTRIGTRVSEITAGSTAESPLIVTIGVDAFAFATFSGQGPATSDGRKQQFSNGFLYLGIPLDATLPVRIIHIEPATNGCFNARITGLVEDVITSYKANNCQVWFVATDGDRFLSAAHDSFFEKHIAPHETDFFALLGDLFDHVQSGNWIPIADPLHFGKNMRGKLLDHKVAVIENGQPIRTTSAAHLEQYLKLGDTLTDTSQIGRMRDYYLTKLFTLGNVLVLLKSRVFHSALLLLPYACVYSVLYCSNLSVTARVFLLRLAYLTYQRLCEEATRLVKSKSGVRYRGGKGVHAIVMAEVSFFRRMMNTCLGLALALTRSTRHVRLDAVGTHLVENFIGIARSTSNSPDFGKIVAAFANSDMRKKIAHNCGLQLHVARRINDGGMKVDSLSDEGISQPKSWDPHDIVNMIIERHKAFGGTESDEFEQFVSEFELFVKSVDIHQLHHPSAVANALIVERNYKFNSAPKRQSPAAEQESQESSNEVP